MRTRAVKSVVVSVKPGTVLPLPSQIRSIHTGQSGFRATRIGLPLHQETPTHQPKARSRYQQTRSASSSSSLSSLLPRGFFGRLAHSPPPIDTQQDPLDVLRKALSKEDLPRLRAACRIVLDRRKGKARETPPDINGDGTELSLEALSLDELEQTMRIYLQRGNAGDLEMVDAIWRKSGSKSAGMADLVVTAKLKWDTARSAMHLVENIRREGMAVSPTTLRDVVTALGASGEAQSALEFLADTGAEQPHASLHLVLLNAMVQWPDGYDMELDALLMKLEQFGHTPSVKDLTAQESIYRRAGAKAKAMEAALHIAPFADQQTMDVAGWHAVLRYEAREQGRWDIVERMKQEGLQPNADTSRTLVELAMMDLSEAPRRPGNLAIDAVGAVGALRKIEDRLGFRADAETWAEVVSAALASEVGQSLVPSDLAVKAALQIYHEARKDFIAPTLGTVTELLSAMSCLKRPDLPAMQEIYGELLNAWDETQDISARDRRAPILALISYVRCLGGEANDGMASVTRVLQEMRDRGIKLAMSPKGVADHIIFLMRCASSHHEAFRVYSFVRALDPRALDIHAYEVVLSAFVRLSTSSSRLAPPTLFFEFLKDMRGAGIKPTAKVYAILINQYTKGLRASKLVGDDLTVARQNVLEAIRRAHAYVRLDSFVDLDVPLLNSLMDAYSEVRSFRECFDVWEELVMRIKYDNNLEQYQPSISIVMDACGQGRYLKKAKRIWVWASSGRFPVNQNNWAAYLECLSRSDQVLEAVEDIKAESNRQDRRFDVNEEVLLIPVKFAARRRTSYEKVLGELQEAFPELLPGVASQVTVLWETGRAGAGAVH